MSSPLEEYRAALVAGDETDRVYAAEDLGSLNSADAACTLAEHVRAEKSPQVKEAIFHALQAISDPQVVDCAVDLFSDDDPFVRNRAVELLRRRQAESLERLAVTLRSPDADIRKLSVDALSGCDHEAAAGLYATALRDNDLNVVITAVEAVGRTRRPFLSHEVIALFLSAEHPMLLGACLETMAVHGNAEALEAARSKFGEAGPPDYFLPSFLRLYGKGSYSFNASMLVACLSRSELGIRTAALDCLLCLNQRAVAISANQELFEALQKLVNDGETELLREQARRASAQLTGGCAPWRI